MALSQNKRETYVSPGTSVFVWPCCPLVMWCVQLLLPAQVWPTGLRWAYLSRFSQPIKTLKPFFLLKNEKYFLLKLDLNQVIYFIGMQRQSLGEARDPQRQVLPKSTGWVAFNQFHSPVKLLHWQRMLGNPLFFHRHDHNGSFIFLWPLNTWREN